MEIQGATNQKHWKYVCWWNGENLIMNTNQLLMIALSVPNLQSFQCAQRNASEGIHSHNRIRVVVPGFHLAPVHLQLLGWRGMVDIRSCRPKVGRSGLRYGGHGNGHWTVCYRWEKSLISTISQNGPIYIGQTIKLIDWLIGWLVD